MSIYLSNGSSSIELPEDLEWTNELAWSGVQQATERSITGALIVDVGTLQAGRPIQLRSPDDGGWLARADALTLQSWAATAGAEYTLSIRGTSYTVIFDHEQTAIDAAPLVFYSDPLGTDYVTLSLRFLTVS